MHLLATDVSNAVIRDVAQVRDGYRQSYSVRSNGLRAALLTVLKNGKASTLDIINNDNNAKATLRGNHGRTAAVPRSEATVRPVRVCARIDSRRAACGPL